jgi:N-acetylglucosaminyldiphosphoundecaprenol N-acetyl-beta-D-mannosaminyltransferase
MNEHSEYRKILGVRFYAGDVHGAVEQMRQGGLLVVPAAPALKDLVANAPYREALVNADLAIADSAFMVMIWNLMEGDSVPRVSGLQYLRALLRLNEVREPGNTFWIMARETSARLNLKWLQACGIDVPESCVWLAPVYGPEIDDPELLAAIGRQRPKHIVITLGGGTQERLGLYLKRNLNYLPAIHCIGAAIAFLSGDQVRIPGWADRLFLGWLFRCLSSPSRYIPRYWAARKLLVLMVRYRGELPATAGEEAA